MKKKYEVLSIININSGNLFNDIKTIEGKSQYWAKTSKSFVYVEDCKNKGVPPKTKFKIDIKFLNKYVHSLFDSLEEIDD